VARVSKAAEIERLRSRIQALEEQLAVAGRKEFRERDKTQLARLSHFASRVVNSVDLPGGAISAVRRAIEDDLTWREEEARIFFWKGEAMILTGSKIANEVKSGNIVVEPFDPENVGPNSLDVSLSRELLIYESEVLDPRAKNQTTPITIPDEGLVLEPGELYLASTVEKVGSNVYVPCLEGRSSLARLGVSIHQTAGFGDLGFISRWTMEIMVIRPVRVYPGMRIGQFAFHIPYGDIAKRYSGKYGGNGVGVEASKSYQDREVPDGNSGSGA
jgi:dCTP deaminase